MKFFRSGFFILLSAAVWTGVFFSSCSMIYDYPLSSSNSGCILDLKNYLGNTQNIHPKVLYFEDGWNGYRFWMAYTPYPYSHTNAENPCIAVSNDGLSWTAPPGLVNPLSFPPKGGYNSDTHLVYNVERDILECWWREYDNKTHDEQICRRVSSDGVVWEDREIIIPFSSDQKKGMSPAVWIEDGMYKMVCSNGVRMFLVTVPVGEEKGRWSDPVWLPVEGDDLCFWHHDLIVNEDGDWEMIICAYPPGGNNNTADLYYVKLKADLSEKGTPVCILRKGEGKKDFDHEAIYRSSIVRVGDEVYIYYSGIASNGQRSMSLLRGPSVFDLHGLTPD